MICLKIIIFRLIMSSEKININSIKSLGNEDIKYTPN